MTTILTPRKNFSLVDDQVQSCTLKLGVTGHRYRILALLAAEPGGSRALHTGTTQGGVGQPQVFAILGPGGTFITDYLDITKGYSFPNGILLGAGQPIQLYVKYNNFGRTTAALVCLQALYEDVAP